MSESRVAITLATTTQERAGHPRNPLVVSEKLSGTEIARQWINALSRSGLHVRVISDHPRRRPLMLQVTGDSLATTLRVFVWNVTPGGPEGVRAADEWRVQATRPGDVPFEVAGPAQTLLLGFHAELDVFCAWETRAHPNPKSSSSLQVSFETLGRAARDGYASQARDAGSHVVVAFRPESAGTYLATLPALLELTEAGDIDTATGATNGDGELLDFDPRRPRARSVIQVTRLVRDARFRTRTLIRYDGRCAFCGLGATLAEAAHIQPVASDGSDSDVNGLAACPTHHQAFDKGLLVVAPEGLIRVNSRRCAELALEDEDVDALESSVQERLSSPVIGEAPSGDLLEEHRQLWEVGAKL